MTIEQLAMYLWHSLTLAGLGAILAAGLAIAGTAIYLDGRWLMRSNNICSKTVSRSPTGERIESVTCSTGTGYSYGVKVARSGLAIAFFALAAYAGLMQF